LNTSWEKGLTLPELVCGPVTRLDLVKYAGASGDYNPIHTIEEFAQEVGLDGVIAHGMLTMAYAGRMLTDFAGSEAELAEFGIRFRAVVRPGDEITCRGVIQEVSEQQGTELCKIQIFADNQHGVTVVKGTAVLRRM